MIKSIVKLFIPSGKKLAQMAADGIQKAVNQSDKEALIAKYATIANQATEIQSFVVGLVVDGKIDDVEKNEISDRLAPLFSKLMELI